MNTIKRFTADLNKLSETYVNPNLLQMNDEDLIANTICSEDRYMDRLRIIFKNEHQLSIIRGKYSFGGNKGLFEILVLTEIPDTNIYKEPIGYCTVKDLIKHITYIGNLSTHTKTKEITK